MSSKYCTSLLVFHREIMGFFFFLFYHQNYFCRGIIWVERTSYYNTWQLWTFATDSKTASDVRTTHRIVGELLQYCRGVENIPNLMSKRIGLLWLTTTFAGFTTPVCAVAHTNTLIRVNCLIIPKLRLQHFFFFLLFSAKNCRDFRNFEGGGRFKRRFPGIFPVVLRDGCQ